MTATTKLETPPANAATIVWLPFAADEQGKLIAKKLRGPNARNREIWDAHSVFQRSYRDLAKHYKLSHTRIGQIVKQVDQWLAATHGGRTGTGRQRLIVAETVHEARLDHLFGQALAGWAESGKPSQQMKRVEVTGKPERKETICKTRYGDRRYLESGLKIQNSLFAFQNTRDTGVLTLEEKQADAARVLDEVGVRGNSPQGKQGDTERAEDTEGKAGEGKARGTSEVPVEVGHAGREDVVEVNGNADVSRSAALSESTEVEVLEVTRPADIGRSPGKERKMVAAPLPGRPADGYTFIPRPANWRALENVLLNDVPKDPAPQARVPTIHLACGFGVTRAPGWRG